MPRGVIQPRTRTVQLVPPLGGLNRRNAYQYQAPYTTPDCLNVRPTDIQSGRARIGRRPGLVKELAVWPWPLGTPIRLLNSIDIPEPTPDSLASIIRDTFDGAFAIELQSIGTTHNDFATVVDGAIQFEAGDSGWLRRNISDLDTSQIYTVEALITYPSADATYYIFLRKPNSGVQATFDATGVTIALTYTGTDRIEVTSVGGGAPDPVSGGPYTTVGALPETPTWLRCEVDGNDVAIYWNGSLIATVTVGSGHAANTTVGFGVDVGASPSVEVSDSNGNLFVTRIDEFRVTYFSTSEAPTNYLPRVRLLSTDGDFYREKTAGGFELVSSSPGLSADIPLMSAARGGKLFIADDSPVVASGSVGTFTGTSFDSSAYTDWTTLGIVADAFAIEVFEVTGSVVAGVYPITTVASGSLTIGSYTGGNGDCAFRIRRMPKVYDHAENEIVPWVAATYDNGLSKGSVPIGTPIICRYRDRMVLAGGSTWYMSRQGDPYDWDYGADAEDVGRAVAGTNSEAGSIGERIKAMIPHSDDYLIFGCEKSLWVLRGDPAAGGVIDNVSHEIGILDRYACCRTGEGHTVFLSHDGLYMLPPGGNTTPIPLSRDKLPRELLHIDPSQRTVILAWDGTDRGIYIVFGDGDREDQTGYWFDWDTKSFWPFQAPSTFWPDAVHTIPGVGSESGVVFGCNDGHLRRFSRYANTDDGTAFDSYALIGPVPVAGRLSNDGLVEAMVGVMAQSSADVTWSLFVGDSPEDAFVRAQGTAQETGTWSAGRNRDVRPRRRGVSMLLKIENTDNNNWSLEAVECRMNAVGRHR